MRTCPYQKALRLREFRGGQHIPAGTQPALSGSSDQLVQPVYRELDARWHAGHAVRARCL